MKYRQWKKNYKKKYGANPPFEVDKRKQRRYARKNGEADKYNIADNDGDVNKRD